MQFAPDTDYSTPDFEDYQRVVKGSIHWRCLLKNHGEWSLKMELSMSDEHRGKLLCWVRNYSGYQVWFDADIMVDTDLKIVHFYNPVHSIIKATWHNRIRMGGPDLLRFGMKQVQRGASFPHFFYCFEGLRAYTMQHFYEEHEGWRSAIGFDARHVTNIQNRVYSIALRGGLRALLPACVLKKITDRSTAWAVPVTMDDSMQGSHAYVKWVYNHVCPDCRQVRHG